MAQDLKKMFDKEREQQNFKMKQGHEERFLSKLEETLPQERPSKWNTWKIAASIILLVGVGLMAYFQFDTKDDIPATIVDKGDPDDKNKSFSFGDLSPDLKKVENYYVANINMELSQLDISESNKELVDSFMEQLSELNTEYDRLNGELNELGPNDQTISALIENLQLRLQLLQKLKKKLNQLKSSKNEQITENSI
ncbi:hypothetical protein [Maribacter cobaltidurans]|uniref:Uncharacterized protein n=1 Tax=Maribacter cobaltidurans TaxID=1178778 RepID=A0A223V163_9FLAO|nr:hypothetical protein [Maribacter cobaltidurans]ASV29052.1 hypothetical protein CJ263_01765 [Maribacter cobaltidurans]GGD72298.1 hypothetical protein GCM10011412_07430 [Maribacter cobaltidurans]